MSNPEGEGLKVSAQASLDEIKRAFRRQALALHPDHNPDPAASRHFRRLTEDYRALEARALLRERPKPRPVIWKDRVSLVLADLGRLVKRWPDARWSQVVDGLPAGVWLASILEVLAQNWPPGSAPTPVVPSREGVAQALDEWATRLTAALPDPLPKNPPLAAAVRAAENRLRALERPPRKH